MANAKPKIKTGMGGSSSGKSRWEKTEVLKAESKKQRRLEGENVVNEQLKQYFSSTLIAS